MSVIGPIRDRSGEISTDSGTSWSTPRGSGGVTSDGSRYRIVWRTCPLVKKALFRVATDDRVAVLQHIRETRVQQRGESYCELLEDVGLDEIPDKFLEEMRRDGFTPAEVGR